MRLLGVDPAVEIGAPRPAMEAATTSGCTDGVRWKSMGG